MSLLPPLHRRFLIDQVAAALRSEIVSGCWKQWIPSERSLVRSLSVSRDTVRGALRQWVENRELSRVPRQGYRVGTKLGGQRRMRPIACESGLVSPEQIYSMPTNVIQVVDSLRGMCAESDALSLRVVHCRRSRPIGRAAPTYTRVGRRGLAWSGSKALWGGVEANVYKPR